LQFNVFTLLLGDALNPATPQINGASNETPGCCAFTRHKVVYRHILGVVGFLVAINF